MSCFIFLFVACSDSIEDATSKHVYSEDESPYLKADADATVTTDMEFVFGHIEAQTINLADYADKFQEKMNMSVDQVISGLNDGTVVFYNILVSRNIWNKAEMTKGTTGWYYNTAGGVTADSETYTASLDFDKDAKTLTVNVNEQAEAGTILSLNVGFAVSGTDYDSYVRFSFNLSVTDLSVIILGISIPEGDYASYAIDFVDYEENIQACVGMSAEEFLNNLDYDNNGVETGGTIRMYVIDYETKEWDVTSSYTGEIPGYWMNADGVVCSWGDTGFSVYANTKIDDHTLYIGRAPELAAGTQFNIGIGYRDTTNENNYFRFVITATLE